MTSTATASDMAETLIVLVGENAWNAARAIGSDWARGGKADEARHWRDVARSVLRRMSGSAAPPSAPAAEPSAVSDRVPARASAGAARAAAPVPPIPMRAKLQMALGNAARDAARAGDEFAKAA